MSQDAIFFPQRLFLFRSGTHEFCRRAKLLNFPKTVLEDAGQLPGEFLRKHVAGDWGEVEADDRRENETSVEGGFRILSAYKTPKDVILWVITEADRSSTCVLLPDEY